MTPTLYYTPGTCSLACIVALEWASLRYELCRVDAAARGSNAYRAINPRQQVPAIEIDGKVLVEVNAILEWVNANAQGASLMPTTPWERAAADQWLAAFGSGFHAAFWPYFRPDRYTVDSAGEHGVKASAALAIRREMAAMDAHLASHTFVLGETRSLLDPYLHAMERWAHNVSNVALEYPNVYRHRLAMQSDAAVQFAVAIERDAKTPIGATGCLRHSTFGESM
jgi:glutathione S-transferase